MAMIKCKECGKEISSNAKTCPHCGAPVQKRSGCAIFAMVILVIIFVSYIVSLFQNSNFEDIGYYKNETPNGSYYRVFSVYVKDFQDTPEMWNKILAYAKDKMYTPGGTTVVFFFNDLAHTPDVTFVGVEFDKIYEPYCIASYYKFPKGNESFQKYPFK